MLLEQLTWPDLRTLPDVVFVVPLGAIEQHGPHLPLATDALIAGEIARRIEAAAPDRIVLAPVQWLGHSPHHSYFGCVSLNLRPYMDLLAGVCRSLANLGARRIFLLNAHGGNDAPARAVLCELKVESPGLLVSFASYWSLAGEALARIRTSPAGGMGHACELETSILLELRPDLVRLDRARDAGTFSQSGFHRLDMLKPQPYSMVRNFHELSDNGT
ncbi:MAG: creatininase family protein, partial [Bryobacteraceae bacterium]